MIDQMAVNAVIGEEVSRADPYNEYEHIKPVTVRNAALVLREVNKKLEHARGVQKQYRELVGRAGLVVTEAEEELRQAEYLLKISALQENGGEE